MALKRCSECNGKVSDKALMCPHCGFGMQDSLENLLRTVKNRTSNLEVFNVANPSIPRTEKRAHPRINVNLMAKLNNEAAMLFNISKSGIKLATTINPQESEVSITLENGEQVFNLRGVIRWASSKRSFSNLIDMVVSINEAPPEYYEFIDQLLASQ